MPELAIKESSSNHGSALFKLLCVLYALTVILPALYFLLVLQTSRAPGHGDAGFGLLLLVPVAPVSFGTTLVSIVVLPIYLRRHWASRSIRTLSLAMIVFSLFLIIVFAMTSLR